jgi:hypothetical protein
LRSPVKGLFRSNADIGKVRFLDHSRFTWVTPIRRNKLYLSVDKFDV